MKIRFRSDLAQQPAITIGPLLGIEDENTYTFTIVTNETISRPSLDIDGKIAEFKEITYSPGFSQKVGLTTSTKHNDLVLRDVKYKVWKVSVTIKATKGKTVKYFIKSPEFEKLSNYHTDSWGFYIPGTNEKPKMVLSSCNGFSSKAPEKIHLLWEDLAKKQRKALEGTRVPFALQMLGGDQIYSDQIFKKETFENWEFKNDSISEKQLKKINNFFFLQYWKSFQKSKAVAFCLATIPNIMMWDDHDITDGWGSQRDHKQKSQLYAALFHVGRKYFDLIQMRGASHNKTVINKNNSYSFSLSFKNNKIIALDNRSHRTRKRVMSKEQWNDFKNDLKETENKGMNLLLMTAIPVVYRHFSDLGRIYNVFGIDFEDDVNDHWNHKCHVDEQMTLLFNMFKKTYKRRIILSGDAHLASYGVAKLGQQIIHQLTSSGIVHQPPSVIEYLGIQAVSDDDKVIYVEDDQELELSLKEVAAWGDHSERARNYMILKEGNDDRMWANWYCEDISWNNKHKVEKRGVVALK